MPWSIICSLEVPRSSPCQAKLLVKEDADVNARGQNGKTAAKLLVHDDPDGILREDTEFQQLLAGNDTR